VPFPFNRILATRKAWCLVFVVLTAVTIFIPPDGGFVFFIVAAVVAIFEALRGGRFWADMLPPW
jgi:hypothetical protein